MRGSLKRSPDPLDRAFFARNPRRVARELLGKVLVRQSDGQFLAARIVEVEAYLGKNDPAPTPPRAKPHVIRFCSDLPATPTFISSMAIITA